MSVTLELGTYYVAGLPYHDYKNLKESDKRIIGQPVDLILEPENKYDSNAIKIMYKNQSLGYVTRNQNLILNHLLEQRDICTVLAIISDIDTNLGAIKITYTLEV